LPEPNAPASAAGATSVPAGTPAIELVDVVKRFGATTVLDGLSFSVAKGERVALIGPSGSGKTTILRLLMTLEEADGGFLRVDGEPYTHEVRDGRRVPVPEKRRRQVRRRVGMVFQQFNLFPNMTVLGNIVEAPIHVLGLSRDDAVARADRLLAQVGMAAKRDARPGDLSGGQQQRVAIARALAMDPEILLLDEVTSALDPELVADVLEVLRTLAETTDLTMLIVTHEMQFAREVSHRVLMFDRGRIVEEADPETMFTAPTHERTQAFLRAVLG
jgi:polar amino acid transport system ATP-binding protein